MRVILLLTASLLLTGCARTVYRTQLEIYCPQIAQYDERFNNQLADELESLPAEATAIDEAVKNYIYLRDRIRRCNEEKDKI
jgi:outer membrane biogenesis lipoprotein LolB